MSLPLLLSVADAPNPGVLLCRETLEGLFGHLRLGELNLRVVLVEPQSSWRMRSGVLVESRCEVSIIQVMRF